MMTKESKSRFFFWGGGGGEGGTVGRAGVPGKEMGGGRSEQQFS